MKEDNELEGKIHSLLSQLKSIKTKSDIKDCFRKYSSIVEEYEVLKKVQFNYEKFKTKSKIDKEPSKAIEDMIDDLKDILRYLKS